MVARGNTWPPLTKTATTQRRATPDRFGLAPATFDKQSAPESHLFRTGPAASCAQHRDRIHIQSRPPLPVHDAHRLQPARARHGDRAGTGRVVPAYARATRRRRARRLACRPRGGLSACGPDGRRTPRGRRRLNRAYGKGKPRRGEAGVFRAGDRQLGGTSIARGHQTA